MATLKDVARAAGLSITQTSRALNDHSDVNEMTRERVKAVARSLNYQANISARKLVTGRSGMVALVVPHSADLPRDGLFIEGVAGLSAQFSGRGMQFVLHVAQPEEPITRVYQRLIGNGVLDGFILFSPHDGDPRARFLKERGIPFVVHGRIWPEADHAYFDIDNEGILLESARHLIGLGHRRIAFINGVLGHGFASARMRGYRRALEEAGLAEDPALIRHGEMTEALGLVATVEMFRSGKPAPTAMLCSNVRIAKGVYKALEALGLSIPGDVSVMAHDDHLPMLRASAFFPALSVTKAPLRDSWEPLADCLTGLLDGRPQEELQIVGPHELIIRNSTGPAPA
ncbi:substrate-binding domain-containing protein [Paracoccus binzhouensis]|uniref:substrate-binding domain-containing protein n=1 Tax=Paracoccus binzhouensis TaxID=2796149 RepID=UPI0018EF3067|nr:substrate-binding domain-containing protein [Paracoccus binzhouensis]